MSDNKKYIYACIRIPIEIEENGHHITYNDHAKVDFEKCDELPPKSNLGKFDLQEIFEQLSIKPVPTVPTGPIETIISVLQSEIKTAKSPMKNSSFKNRQSSSRYSQKNRPLIENHRTIHTAND